MMAMTSLTSSSSVRSPHCGGGGGGGYPLSLRDGRAGERTRGEDAHYDDAAAKWVCGVVFFGRQRLRRRDPPLKSQGASLPPRDIPSHNAEGRRRRGGGGRYHLWPVFRIVADERGKKEGRGKCITNRRRKREKKLKIMKPFLFRQRDKTHHSPFLLPPLNLSADTFGKEGRRKGAKWAANELPKISFLPPSSVFSAAAASSHHYAKCEGSKTSNDSSSFMILIVCPPLPSYFENLLSQLKVD